MINVVFVKTGNKYQATHVNRLCRLIHINSTLPIKFHVLTDNPAGIDSEVNCIKIPEDLDGWWNKLWLFWPELPITGDILYFDLDVIPVSNIDELLTYDSSRFTIIQDYGQPDMWYNSSVMKFQAGKYGAMFDNFRRNIATHKRSNQGDQNYITKYLKDNKLPVNLWPDWWCYSYKWGLSHKTKHSYNPLLVPELGKVAVFHGHPKPDELLSDPSHWVSSMISRA